MEVKLPQISVLLTLEDLEMVASHRILSRLLSTLHLVPDRLTSLCTMDRQPSRNTFSWSQVFLYQFFFVLSHTLFLEICRILTITTTKKVVDTMKSMDLERFLSTRQSKPLNSFLVWFRIPLRTFVSGLCPLRIRSSQLYSGRRRCLPPLT